MSRLLINRWTTGSTSLLALGLALLSSSHAQAQRPTVNYFHRSDMPPGVVGQQQLLRSPLMRGHSQAVEILAPEGVQISLMVSGQFDAPRPGPVHAGMQIGFVYPLKITNIPFHEGAELYPTVELVNRLYPPAGIQRRFPVPVELTREEIEMALDGRFVTRVIYLEDPDGALPQKDDPKHQRFVEVGAQEDPLYVADRLGRPMAILRMGSRVPDNDLSTGLPAFSSPPIELYETPDESANQQAVERTSRAIEREQRDIPRVPLLRRSNSAQRSPEVTVPQ